MKTPTGSTRSIRAWRSSISPAIRSRGTHGLFRVVDRIVQDLDHVYPRDDRPYYEERRAFMTSMASYERASSLIVKYLGGSYTSRAHRGQRGGEGPVRPIPRAEQKRAFDLLAAHEFAAGAFQFSPELIRHLGADRYSHWNSTGGTQRQDFPFGDFVAQMQDGAIEDVLSPLTQSRIADQEALGRGAADVMTLRDLFDWMNAAVFDDIATAGPHSIGPPRPIDPLQTGAATPLRGALDRLRPRSEFVTRPNRLPERHRGPRPLRTRAPAAPNRRPPSFAAPRHRNTGSFGESATSRNGSPDGAIDPVELTAAA